MGKGFRLRAYLGRSKKKTHRVRAVLASLALLSLAGCLGGGSGTGIFTKSAQSVLKSQNCEVPDTFAVNNIVRRLAAEGSVVGPDFCAKPENYACYRRVFSPTAAEGQGIDEECTQVAALGGAMCMKLESRVYNTREASLLPDTTSSAVAPGGEFNRVEYVCHQKLLKDGDQFLATGEGEVLKDALLSAFGKCGAVAPRLAPAGGEK
jgi:hypothetical protein